MIKPQRFKATLTKKEKISSKVYEVCFTLNEPPEVEFKAGHTVMIYMTPGVNRSMSIASPPKEKNVITFCWDITPMGPGCQWLLARNLGDPVEFMAPLGVFLYDAESPRKALFVATGTGVAPFHSALHEYLGTGTMKPATLYWGLRHEEDRFWQQKFEGLTTQYPSFQYKLVLSQPTETWMGRKGHVQDFIFTEETDVVNCDFYLCGSGKMVDEMVKILTEKGVPAAQIKKELYFKATTAPPQA